MANDFDATQPLKPTWIYYAIEFIRITLLMLFLFCGLVGSEYVLRFFGASAKASGVSEAIVLGHDQYDWDIAMSEGADELR